MKAINRLHEYLKIKGLKPTRFEKTIGLSNGYLGTQEKRDADLGEGVFVKIIDYCLDLDPIWLLTGKGSMLRDEQPAQPMQTVVPTIIYKSDPKDLKIIALQEDKIKTLEEKIKILEEKPSSQPQVLATSRSVDTITITGTQSTHK